MRGALRRRREAGRRETSSPMLEAIRIPSRTSSCRRRMSVSRITFADPGALLRPPERVLDEDRQQPVGRLDQPVLRLLRRPFEQDALVRDARAVVDAVVDREPVAEVLQQGAARGAGDQPEARDDQPLEEDLHLEHLLLERLRLEGHLRQRVEVRVALGDAAGLARRASATPRRGAPRPAPSSSSRASPRGGAPGSAAAPPSRRRARRPGAAA